ncbi:MAG: peptidylprolyl isomerase [Gemmatimonadaceae bacterium]|nr:peptidylprolyl isomerase [Gemmatimonadaceae bacterium]
MWSAFAIPFVLVAMVAPASWSTCHDACDTPSHGAVRTARVARPVHAVHPVRAVGTPPDELPSAYRIREAEHQRLVDTLFWARAVRAPDAARLRVAARAIGRIEDQALAERFLVPLLASPHAAVRREAAWGLAQARVPLDYTRVLARERDLGVRGALYEAMGRSDLVSDATASVLLLALREERNAARAGAARGLHALARRVPRGQRLGSLASMQLWDVIRVGQEPPGPQDRDPARPRGPVAPESLRATLLRAWATDPQRDRSLPAGDLASATSDELRRLAQQSVGGLPDVSASDPSLRVRLASLVSHASCTNARAALRDPSEHVSLTAADLLGTLPCPEAIATLDTLANAASSWRMRGHALVSYARLAPDRVRPVLARAAQSPTWQLRAWAAQAARLARDSTVLRELARDTAPNVAIAAMMTPDDALRALRSEHAGLVLEGATRLKALPAAALREARPALLAALERLTQRREASLRDPRVALLERLADVADTTTARVLRPLVTDDDPAVALLAARIIAQHAGDRPDSAALRAIATRRPPALPFPDSVTLAALDGARAIVRLAGLGEIELVFLTEEAPATVATVVALAERGAYDGTTFHRVVPNFVIQGGSPGADEYDARTPTFMRDEVGGRHDRGTWGISTRGRDTGDGQLFANLVDNPRLDHEYTVFARTVRGLDVLDRVQEGAVITSVTIADRARVTPAGLVRLVHGDPATTPWCPGPRPLPSLRCAPSSAP